MLTLCALVTFSAGIALAYHEGVEMWDMIATSKSPFTQIARDAAALGFYVVVGLSAVVTAAYAFVCAWV